MGGLRHVTHLTLDFREDTSISDKSFKDLSNAIGQLEFLVQLKLDFRSFVQKCGQIGNSGV